MVNAHKKTLVLSIALVCVASLSGCTDWKKRYDYLNVEHKNTEGLYQNTLQAKTELEARVAQDQQTIAELQRQIDEMHRTPADATGFGPGYDVAFDASKGTITVTLSNAILFDSGQAALKSTTSKELDHILSVLRQKYAGRDIDVIGHTDSDPIVKSKWDDNWELSAERALSVARYLMKRGIPENKLEAGGCGHARPIASNATAEGKAKNRRVEIVVHIRSAAPAAAPPK